MEHSLGEHYAYQDRSRAEPRAALPHCVICKRNLPDLRYECQQCHGCSFCLDYRGHHSTSTYHVLKIFTSPFTDPDTSETSDGEPDLAQRSRSSGHTTDDEIGIDDEAVIDDEAGTDDEDGTDDADGKNDENQQLGPIRPRPRTTPSSSITMSITNFTRMTNAMARATNHMQIVLGAAQQLLRANTAGPNASLTASRVEPASESVIVPSSLLNFPIDFATLEREDEEDGEEIDLTMATSASVKTRRRGRQWSNDDRHRLRRMKVKGWTDERISTALNRTVSAVQQQWRKQGS